MTRPPRIPGLRRLFRLPDSARTIAADVDEEIRFHLSSRVAELVARGLPEHEARSIAEREFGSVDDSRRELFTVDHQRVASERRAEWWESVWQDLRYAMRGLGHRPGLAIVVAVTLTLGIGANAVMFGIIDRVLLRAPAGVVDPNRVLRVHFAAGGGAPAASAQPVTTYSALVALRKQVSSAEAVAGLFRGTYTLGRGPDAGPADVGMVSGNYFDLLGVRPFRGRFFVQDEDIPASPVRVVVLSHRFWQFRFAAAEDIVGRVIPLDGESFTVIGIAPKEFTGIDLDNIDLWVPISALGAKNFGPNWYTGQYAWWVRPIVRLRSGATSAQFNAEATLTWRRLVKSWNEPWRDTTDVVITSSIHASRGPQGTTTVGRVAIWLMGVSAVVLLVACANVANLLIARAVQRQREIAVRVALGVSRPRLVRQLLSEALLLAAIAAGSALLAAYWGGRVVQQVLLPDVMSSGGAIDRRVLIFTAVLMVVTGILAGLAPALHALRTDVVTSLKAGARQGIGRTRARTALLVAQVALSVVLLVGAGLFVRSLTNVRNIDVGIDVDRVLMVTMELRRVGIDAQRSAELYRAAQARVGLLPGVERTSLVAYSSPMGPAAAMSVVPQGVDSAPDPPLGGPYVSAIDQDYFATLGSTVVRGRGLTSDDLRAPSRVMVINESLARHFWGDRDPVGTCAFLRGEKVCTTIVGVVETVLQFRILNDQRAMAFLPMSHPVVDLQRRPPSALFVRVRDDDPRFRGLIRREIQALAAGMPYVRVQRFAELVAPEIRPWRLGATMFGVFGVMALLIAAVGLYSVMAYWVSQRTYEFGVRFALGARGGDVAGLVLGEAFRVVVIGVVIGAGLALLGSRWLDPLLYETSTRDPSLYAGVAFVLAAAALVASFVPLRRSARIDPIVALRAE